MEATKQQMDAINDVLKAHNNRLYLEHLERAKNTYVLNPHREIRDWNTYYDKHKSEVDNAIWDRINRQ